MRRRRLAQAWRQSPYYLDKPKPKPVGDDAEIERYSDKYRGAAKARGGAPLDKLAITTLEQQKRTHTDTPPPSPAAAG